MLRCADGHWVMGSSFKQVDSLSYLPSTIVYGIYPEMFYQGILPSRIRLNETVTSPTEGAALHVHVVHRDHRTANAAEYSNEGEEWCVAVFEA